MGSGTRWGVAAAVLLAGTVIAVAWWWWWWDPPNSSPRIVAAPVPPPPPAVPASDPEVLATEDPPTAAPAPRRTRPAPPPAPPPPDAPAVPPTAAPPWSLDWNPTVPDRFRPSAFETNVRAAVDACQPEHLELIAVDCTGAPCYAVFRGEDLRTKETGDNELMQAFASNCPGWKEPYEDAVYGMTRHSTAFRCPDGSREWIILFGSELVLPYLGIDTEEREVTTKADAEARVRVWRAGWRCAG